MDSHAVANSDENRTSSDPVHRLADIVHSDNSAISSERAMEGSKSSSSSLSWMDYKELYNYENKDEYNDYRLGILVSSRRCRRSSQKRAKYTPLAPTATCQSRFPFAPPTRFLPISRRTSSLSRLPMNEWSSVALQNPETLIHLPTAIPIGTAGNVIVLVSFTITRMILAEKSSLPLYFLIDRVITVEHPLQFEHEPRSSPSIKSPLSLIFLFLSTLSRQRGRRFYRPFPVSLPKAP